MASNAVVGLRRGKQKVLSMTVNNEQNISMNRLATVGKFVILFIVVFVALVCILLYFHLYMLIAFFAIFALAISVVLFAKQTRFKIYSLPAFITSIFFGASCSIMAYDVYSDVISGHTKTSLQLLGVGLFMIGAGLAMATIGAVMSTIIPPNKSNFWKLVMPFIGGASMITSGLYMVLLFR